MLATLRTLSGFVSVFALVGALIATASAPGLLAWYHAPAAGAALCNCQEVARATATEMVKAQLGGVLAGAVVGLGTVIAWIRRQRRKEKEKAAATAAVTPAVSAVAAAPAAPALPAPAAGTDSKPTG
ncbi:MAG: hypothetical protein HY904_14800 [Deltaproteobacteria bacterium]|nr:hypothetical protein [Deltaproteobacteria bacterium]